MTNSVYSNSRPEHNRKAPPGRNRAKTGPTPKRSTQRAARYRAYTRSDMIMGSRGWQRISLASPYCREAVHDAINAIPDTPAGWKELRWLADDARTFKELSDHCDVFAARYPDDPRWDSWRAYRRAELAAAS